MVCIATFYSHYGAMAFKRACDRLGVPARLMPVPRDLSSSCGTCVRYEGDCPLPGWPEEAEQAVEVTEWGYRLLWRAADS